MISDSAPAHRLDVVAIDDDDSIRWLLGELLSLAGVSYALAGSGAQGLRLVSQHRPQLVIADVKLGGMDGLEVARRVNQALPQTEIILVTGYSETARELSDEIPGVRRVLDKPFDINELLELITEIVGPGVSTAGTPDSVQAKAVTGG